MGRLAAAEPHIVAPAAAHAVGVDALPDRHPSRAIACRAKRRPLQNNLGTFLATLFLVRREGARRLKIFGEFEITVLFHFGARKCPQNRNY
jgi:hypothetical protein